MKKYLYFSLALFTAVVGFYFFSSWAQLPKGERYIYPLDDVYIHLALAKNFAEHGVWSVNTSGFDSASSSILYTLILSALIKVFGNWEYYPLIINVTFGYLTLCTFYRFFKDFYGERELKWGLVLILPFSLLYFMALIGMEHTLHMFLMVLVIYLIKKNLQSSFQKKDFVFLLIAIFFLSIVRFESMFFTCSFAMALFFRKSYYKGLLVLIVGFISICVFGFISEKHGGFFFPNSVMIKGSYPSGGNKLLGVWELVRGGILMNTSFYKCLFVPFFLILLSLIKKYNGFSLFKILKNETLIVTIVSMGLLHSLFAFLKYRYENYLMIAVLMIIIPIIASFTKNISLKINRQNFVNFSAIGAVTIVVAVSIYRFGYHHRPLLLGSKGIASQQIEMANFLKLHYEKEKVVANDIGAIAYFSNVQLLDMVGLGSTEVAKIKVANKGNTREEYIKSNKKFINDYVLKNNYKIAVIYPEWFPGGTPSNWTPVASWTIDNKYGPAIERVVFYAISPSEVPVLQKKLSQYKLGPNTEQWFYRLR